ncbi:MAG: DUF368 domain-containing protein [Anaerolineae bacterium]|nr:DUF368 domain-containing protein [Anaerolineae bacterium]
MLDRKDHSRPKTPREFIRLFFTGFAMGASDIVPGVSGGTMAFILGIYENLINAIKSFDLTAIRLALSLKFREFLQHVPLPFLIALGLGIGTAILLLSTALSNLLENNPTFLFSFFAGLILASIVAIGIKIQWNLSRFLALLVGAAVAFVVVGLPVLREANHTPLVLFASGMIAICAMILPGISGSFILLILGQYEFVLNAVRDRDVLSLAFVAVGCVIGIVAFSRILSYLLKHYYQTTIAVLTGFMIGSLRTIWERGVAGTELLDSVGAPEILFVIFLVIAGFALVSLLDHVQTRANPVVSLFVRTNRKPQEVLAK